MELLQRAVLVSVLRALAAVLAVAASACGDDRACVPGAAAACACTDGRPGSQSCNAAGTALDPCVCEGRTEDAGGDAGGTEVDATPDAGDSGAADSGVAPDGSPSMMVTPTAVTFGVVPVGQTEAREITIRNEGDGHLLITHVAFTGSGQFTLTLGDLHTGPAGSAVLEEPVVVPPGDLVRATLTYAPYEAEPAEATLILFANDPAFTGGLQVWIQAYQAEPCVKMQAPTVDFGTVPVGVEAVRTLTMRSCGAQPLVVTGVALDPALSHPAYALELPDGVAPSAEAPLVLEDALPVPLTLRFLPTAPSAQAEDGTLVPDEARLRVDSNAGPPTWVTLSGRAVGVGEPAAVLSIDEGTAVIPQTLLHLRGDQSTADGGPVDTYQWTVAQPPGSVSLFEPSDTAPNPTFEANVVGTYTFTLTVRDGFQQPSAPASLDVVVAPDEAVHVELLWDTPNDPDQRDEGPEAGADLDLHFAHPYASGPDLDGDGEPDGWFDQPFDCFWFNPNPNWASFDPAVNDDPGLDRDDTDGAGPENLNLDLPESGVTYRIGVHYWHDHKVGPSYASLRVWVFGELVWERTGVKLVNHDLWEAATLEWPSGEVRAVALPGGADKITPNYENPYFYEP